MKKCFTCMLPIALLSLVPACQKKTADQVNDETTPKETTGVSQEEKDLLTRGDKASSALLGSLGPKLKAALKAGGPAHALTLCQQLAQPLSGEVSDQFAGLTIRRVSLKPRNSENTADELDRKVLTAWEKQIAAGGGVPADEIRYQADKSAVFYRPIITQDVCMKCHGDPSTFSKELSDSLAKIYPQDMATGYTTGQLRGAFRVEFDGTSE